MPKQNFVNTVISNFKDLNTLIMCGTYIFNSIFIKQDFCTNHNSTFLY